MLLVRRPLRALLTDSRNGRDHARHARQEQGGGDNARDVSVIPRLSSGEDHHGQDASHQQHAKTMALYLTVFRTRMESSLMAGLLRRVKCL